MNASFQQVVFMAPDIDAGVFLTECDPSAFRAGEFVDVEIVDAHGYDLIARP